MKQTRALILGIIALSVLVGLGIYQCFKSKPKTEEKPEEKKETTETTESVLNSAPEDNKQA